MNSTFSQYTHPKDPDLLVKERQLPTNLEDEIKEGFFELKQKFTESA